MESKFSRTDFKSWRFEKIIGLSEKKKVLDEYPELKKYPEFKESNYKKMRLSFDKVLRYVFIMYSDTILNQTVPELAKRKKEACLLAGFEPSEETGKFAGDIESMLLCDNKEVNKIIIRVIRLNKNEKFQDYIAYQELRFRQFSSMIDGGDKATELIKSVSQLSSIVENLRNELLNNDNATNLLDELYNEIDNETLGIKPEEIAQLKKDGVFDKVIKGPYEFTSSAKKV